MAAGRLVLAAAVVGGACAPRERLPDAGVGAAPEAHVAAAVRADALGRARVWAPPPVPVAEFDFLADPSGLGQEEVSCRFRASSSGGRTPKFTCVLADGQALKVKYGFHNGETRAEVAGSRLLTALGFGADRMHAVRRVRCLGCPAYPYPYQPWLDSLLADPGRVRTFRHAVIERPFPGREVRTAAVEGWGWHELRRHGGGEAGGRRAEREAFFLAAAFLNHWDNKADNQALVCLDPAGGAGGCGRPFAFVQDLGSTFGPWKMDLAGWRAHRVFADAATCRLSMRGLPFAGGTFPEVRIGEGGRLFLLSLLRELRPEQVRALFAGARVHDAPGAGPQDVARWAAAFHERVRQIEEAGPCPEP